MSKNLLLIPFLLQVSATMEREKSRIYTENLVLEELPLGQTSKLYVRLAGTGMGTPIYVPTIVVRGPEEGPIVGITAAIHGNELNGIPVIHRLLQDLKVKIGTVIMVPIVNVPGFLIQTREFNDGVDLNRIMPGDPQGSCSQIFAHRFVERILKKFNYLLDLHTASFGRINSMYVRADLTKKETAWMAQVQHADLILQNWGADGNLRQTASNLGIHAVTIEIGNPHLFQPRLVEEVYWGLRNVLSRLGMISDPLVPPKKEPMVCSRSYWIYTKTGGILEVFPPLLKELKKGDPLGRVKNVFGEVTDEYFAPEDGIVIGKSVNPVSQTGSRVLHLGILAGQEDFTSYLF